MTNLIVLSLFFIVGIILLVKGIKDNEIVDKVVGITFIGCVIFTIINVIIYACFLVFG